jgi:hypothetical protein
MTHRERFYAALRGQPTDRIPFIARIELWFNTAKARNLLPQPYSQMSMWEFGRAMGFGLYGREACIFSREFRGVDILQKRDGDLLRTEYHTPKGILWKTQRMTQDTQDAGAQYHILDHPFKTDADFEPLEFIFENLVFHRVDREWEKQEEEIGEDGISRANACPCPTHDIMTNWMGDERAIYEFYDHPEQMERLIEILRGSYRQMQEIVLDSEADIVLTGANFTTMITSPPLFRKYFLPYYKDFNSRLIVRGKIPMAHTDGELGGGLMPLIPESLFKIADAFPPPPATSVTVREALDTWDGQVLVFGGIPSMMFSGIVSDTEFESYVKALLLSIRQTDRFVLGFGDTVAMDADFSRVLLMSRLYREYGGYTE